MSQSWRVYCNTESAWSYGFGSSSPSVCFNNGTHTINSSSQQRLDEVPSNFNSQQIYGLGTDGSVVISTNTTLTKDMYYINLTINAGITLFPAGFRIFVLNTLKFMSSTSSISVDGGNANAGTGGISSNPYCDLVASSYSTFLGGSTNGANGRTTSGIGASSTGTTASNYSIISSSGNGGSSTSYAGGISGTTNIVQAIDGGVNIMDTLPNAMMGRMNINYYNIAINSSSSGSAGGLTLGTGIGCISGAGGNSAGIMIVVARYIIATSGGIFTAKGGNGSNATASILGTASIGGGSAGNGGIISIITSTPWSSLSITTNISPGTPGTGLGTGGQSGSASSNGKLIINQV